MQQARLPCPSLSSRACSNSCPLSWWCHPTISSSVVIFSSYLQSFPASGSFLMSQLFASGGQSIGTSTSVLSVNIQDWFPLGLTGWISFQSKGLTRVFSSTTVWKHQFFSAQPSLWSNSHICTWLLIDYVILLSLLFPSGTAIFGYYTSFLLSWFLFPCAFLSGRLLKSVFKTLYCLLFKKFHCHVFHF